MSRTQKIVLFVVLPALAFPLLLCVASYILLPLLAMKALGGGPEEARRMGAQIADYTVPPGYEEAEGRDLHSSQWVTILPSNHHAGMVIMLMQFNAYSSGNYDRDQMERQMQNASQYQPFDTAPPTGQQTVTIRGEPTTLAVSETGASAGRARKATGVFTGKNGMVMLSVVGDMYSWDWRIIEDFCASIR